MSCMFQPRIAEIEERLNSRKDKINELQKKKNAVTDKIYANFCSKIGISDIRLVYFANFLRSKRDIFYSSESMSSVRCDFIRKRRIN